MGLDRNIHFPPLGDAIGLMKVGKSRIFGVKQAGHSFERERNAPEPGMLTRDMTTRSEITSHHQY
jgi:hypothetical protein